MDPSHDAKVSQLVAMGYEATKADNALKAGAGDIETAVEILLADDYEQVSMPPAGSAAAGAGFGGGMGGSTSRAAPGGFVPPSMGGSGVPGTTNTESMTDIQGKTAKQVLDMWGKKMLGDEKHQEVRSHVKSGCKATKSAWLRACDKAKEIDEQNQLTTKAKESFSKCDQQMRSFDEKNKWSEKAQQAAVQAQRGLSKGVESAKRSMNTEARPAESRQDAGGATMF